MKVLLIKTSSMGDVIHTLPAVTDAAKAMPDLSVDWVVEESFAEIPAWHPQVNRVIPVAWRRWRKQLLSRKTQQEIKAFWQALRAEKYDFVLDAQGLVKSALLTRMAKGKRGGLDWGSARESLAALFYQKTCTVNFYQHAIVRMRSIFSALLDYPLPHTVPAYGIARQQFLDPAEQQHYLVFLHGTTWDTKLWPESYWLALAQKAANEGLMVKLLWGNPSEQARANRLAAQAKNITVLPRQTLQGSAKLLANARAIVSLDTGLAHLTAALDVPSVSLYGPTNPDYSGTQGHHQICLAAHFPCAPCQKRQCTYPGRTVTTPACFSALPPEKVWEVLTTIL